MMVSKKNLWLAGCMLLCLQSYAANLPDSSESETALATQAPMPRARQTLPPSLEQSRFNLSPTNKPRTDLMPPQQPTAANNGSKSMDAISDCKDMNVLATHHGNALADYLTGLPDYECHYGLFSLTAAQAAQVYSAGNFSAVAQRFALEARIYNADNRTLVNLLIYLRAGYYLAGNNTIPKPSSSLLATLRVPIRQLVDGDILFRDNAEAPTSASETLKLITNMADETYYLSSMKNLILRYTSSVNNPYAAEALRHATAAGGFTGALTVFFYAHGRDEGRSILQNDMSYATALNNFVVSNTPALIGTETAYQLTDAANEAFRFFRYPAQKNNIKAMTQELLAGSSMTGPSSELWMAGAVSVKHNDNANCAEYGTCNFTTRLVDAVLKNTYACSPSLSIRAQDMNLAQMQASCSRLKIQESYFHQILQTGGKPVANDRNASLEVVVFNDYRNYNKYAAALYDISTNNGGVYLEGSPHIIGNQARLIAHQASWMRPQFRIWNLEHEYLHYLDGRFNMYGNFGTSTAKPTVWWIEGLAEYLSKKNDNQEAINVSHTRRYRLSHIFGNHYAMNDYQLRAYRWGYMATRFMFERHRRDVDAIVGRFRVGDYAGYQNIMAHIGNRYDNEFAVWARSSSAKTDPMLPNDKQLPLCTSPRYLGKNCTISGFASADRAYAFIRLPVGARNLKLTTSGGSGDVDLYLSLNGYPTQTWYGAASKRLGNLESIAITSPTSERWYYIMLSARQPFRGVNLSATYD